MKMTAMFASSRDACRRLAEPWRARWHRLPANDRRALQWLGALLLLSMAWVVIWQPALQRLREARDTFEQQRDLHGYLRVHAGDVSAVEPAALVAPGQLQDVVVSSAAVSGLVIERLEDGGTAGLEVILADAPAEQLLGWIGKLESRGIQLATLEMVPTKPGRSDARMVFRQHEGEEG